MHDLAQHNSMAASSHDGKKKAAVADDGSIVNTMTKMKYPRIGKKDREGQILETGQVSTFVKRDCSHKIETQITAT